MSSSNTNNDNNQTTETNINDDSNSRGSNFRRQNRGNRTNNNQRPSSEFKDWKGLTEDIGAIVGLKRENLTHKKTFDEFREKLLNYVTGNFTKGNDLHCVIREYENPLTKIEKDIPKHSGTAGATDEEKEIEKMILQEKVKNMSIVWIWLKTI